MDKSGAKIQPISSCKQPANSSFIVLLFPGPARFKIRNIDKIHRKNIIYSERGEDDEKAAFGFTGKAP